MRRVKHPLLDEERELIELMGLEEVVNDLSDDEFEAFSTDVRKALFNISEHKQLQGFFVKLFSSYQGGTNATIDIILKEMLDLAHEPATSGALFITGVSFFLQRLTAVLELTNFPAYARVALN